MLSITSFLRSTWGWHRISIGLAYLTSAVISLAARSNPAISLLRVSRSSCARSVCSRRLRRNVAYNLSPFNWFFRSCTTCRVARPTSSSVSGSLALARAGFIGNMIRGEVYELDAIKLSFCVVFQCEHNNKLKRAYASHALGYRLLTAAVTLQRNQ